MSQFYTPPDFTSIIKDIKNRLQALANSQSAPVPQASMSFSANQSIPNNVATALTFDTTPNPTDFSSGGAITSSGGIKVPRAGLYLLVLYVRWVEVANTTGYRQIFVGNAVDLAWPGVASQFINQRAVVLQRLTAGATVTAVAFQNSGGALSLYGSGTSPNQLAASFISN